MTANRLHKTLYETHSHIEITSIKCWTQLCQLHAHMSSEFSSFEFTLHLADGNIFLFNRNNILNGRKVPRMSRIKMRLIRIKMSLGISWFEKKDRVESILRECTAMLLNRLCTQHNRNAWMCFFIWINPF